MKKLYFLLLLCAAIFTSCQSDPVEDMVGTYTYTESGIYTIAGQSKQMNNTGTFTVRRGSGNEIKFTGDFIATGYLLTDGNLLINPDTDDFTSDGIVYHFDNVYSEGKYFVIGSMSWKQTTAITAKYNGQTLKGEMQLYVSARKR